MGKTYLKSGLRAVKNSRSRFAAIFAIVALGVGFLVGLLSTTPDMRYSFDRYFADSAMYDLRLLCSLGFSQEDVEVLAALEGVEQLRPGYMAELLMRTRPDREYAVRFHSLGQAEESEMNRPLLTEGRFPAAPDECLLVNVPSGHSARPALGSRIWVSEHAKNVALQLETRDFTVVGYADYCPYFSAEKEFTAIGGGTIDLILLAPDESFVREAYTELCLTVKGTEGLSALTEAYSGQLKAAMEEVKSISGQRSRLRLAAFRAEIQERLNQGSATLQGMRQELSQGETRLSEAEEKLESGESELETLRLQLESGELSLKKAENDMEQQSLPVMAGGFGKDWLAAARQRLSEQREQLDEGRRRLEAEEMRLSAARADLEREREAFESVRRETEQALQKAESDLKEGARQLRAAKLPVWQVLSRENNISYFSLNGSIDKVGAIAKVFPFFFFLVAALVSLTTMTRMVEEERLEIGTMKALGYGNGMIMGKYLLYAFTASVSGSVVGAVAGFRLFPAAIWEVYSVMYQLPRFYYPINWGFALAASGAVVSCTLLATANACRASLAAQPAQLLRAKAPRPGRRIFLERIDPLWRRLSFAHKVTARNLLRYKKRFFMTVLGVAGCTALLVAALGLRDSLADISERQYGLLHNYDITAHLNREAEAEAALEALLGDNGTVSASLRLHAGRLLVQNGDRALEIQSFIPEKAGDMQGFVQLQERKSGRTLPFSEDSVILTEKAAELLRLRVGDSLRLKTPEGAAGDFQLTGICENYLGNYVFMTEATYATGLSRLPAQNRLLLRLNERAAPREAGRRLLATGAVSGLSYMADAKETFVRSISRIDNIVYVVILSAGVLAMVVLYNLTNINISERVKELATLKVLGFTEMELRAYLNREILTLTLLGAALGLGLGIFLHRYIVAGAELNILMFGRQVRGLSFLLAGALTLLFGMTAALLLQGKLRRIGMVESMKSPE